MKIWGLLGPESERSAREKAMRDLIRSEHKPAPSLPCGIWDCAPNPPKETRAEWLLNAFPDMPKKQAQKLGALRWFQAKEKDREKYLKKAVAFVVSRGIVTT